MNIKLEIDSEQYEIDLREDYFSAFFNLPLSTWGYELFELNPDGGRVLLGDESDDTYDSAVEAASAAMSHLIGILTNEDHSNWYKKDNQ